MCAKAVSSKSNFSVVPWGGAAFNATQFSRQQLLNKHSRYVMMKGFRLSIARHFQSCNFCVPTIIHPCSILPLACPKMPCIYISYFIVFNFLLRVQHDVVRFSPLPECFQVPNFLLPCYGVAISRQVY